MGEEVVGPQQRLPAPHETARDDVPVSSTVASNTCPPPVPPTISISSHHGGSSSQESGAAIAEVEDDAKAQARSERKRSREKQRRSDVNKQFADLADIIRKIETEDASTRFVGSATSNGLPLASRTGPTNRVDLMARTIHMLEQLHSTNKKHKSQRSSLEKQLEEMKKVAEDTAARLKEATSYQQGPQKQVVMMVPMMMTPSADGRVSQMPTGAPPGAFMQPQPFMNTMSGYPGAATMPGYAMAPQPHATPVAAPTTAASAPKPAPSAPAPPVAVAAAPSMAMAPSAGPAAASVPVTANMMMQPQYQMMFPQPMMPPTMMVPRAAAPVATAAPAAPTTAAAPVATTTTQQQQPQGEPKSAPDAAAPAIGENLAHCA